jgi:hypothetical protein
VSSIDVKGGGQAVAEVAARAQRSIINFIVDSNAARFRKDKVGATMNSVLDKRRQLMRCGS